ncbi:MAG: hypothetical protein ABG776_01570 [Cyanobacteria bacterium J06555_13]
MDSRLNIQKEVEDLQQQLLSIKEQGPFLQGVRVERTPAGGTASREAQAECKYARLRAGKGNLLDNGKKSKYIPVREIDQYQAMCARGKAISQLERKIQKLQQELARLNAIAAELGLL